MKASETTASVAADAVVTQLRTATVLMVALINICSSSNNQRVHHHHYHHHRHCTKLGSSESINQSIKVFLEWPKRHCHCKVHCKKAARRQRGLHYTTTASKIQTFAARR